MAENTSELVVETFKLTKIYQNRQIALNDVTLRVEPGCGLGLLGRGGGDGGDDLAGVAHRRVLRWRLHRGIAQLGALQANVQELATHRNTALRMFMASRGTTTAMAQREFWLEFAWIDQEYRVAVRKLAQFCTRHGASSFGGERVL